MRPSEMDPEMGWGGGGDGKYLFEKGLNKKWGD